MLVDGLVVDAGTMAYNHAISVLEFNPVWFTIVCNMEIALAKVVTIIILLMMIVSSVTPSVASVLDPQIPNV